jgi:D-beta-D-heptose 7-phosphate kinase/D-beta-D-heptose 1-phosphate adenosyltransferase
VIQDKIQSLSKLKQITQRAKNKKKKIVFTNGCFDILHTGHVTYLEKARRLGDILIVALNTDSTVRKLKGRNRPINKLKDREKVMAALESVTYVTSFSEPTPLKLIQTLKPHVLTKGGDWKIHQIVGAKEVLSWRGKVYSIAFVKGRSTTKILNRIKARR